jgi:hypothetical protein
MKVVAPPMTGSTQHASRTHKCRYVRLCPVGGMSPARGRIGVEVAAPKPETGKHG